MIDLNETSGKLVCLKTVANKTAINFIATFFQPHFTLSYLDLSDSAFDDDCVTILCEAVKLNCSVIILNLDNCHISSKGVITIAGMLQVNNTLQYIILDYNNFSSDDLIQVLVIMKSNTTLRLTDVSSKLLQEPVKKQLEIFNKKEDMH